MRSELPTGEVRYSYGARLPGHHKLVEHTERFVEVNVGVPRMDLVEIDVVNAETTQAGLDRSCEVATTGAAVGGIGPHREAALGRQDDVVAPATTAEPAPDELLGDTGRVHVRRVDETPAGGYVPIQDRARGRFVRFRTKGHRAKPKNRNQQGRRPKCSLFHQPRLGRAGVRSVTRRGPSVRRGLCFVIRGPTAPWVWCVHTGRCVGRPLDPIWLGRNH